MAVAEWDSEEWRRIRDDRLQAWMLGDQEAFRVALALSTIAETWDDLLDGDRKVSEDEINTAFIAALVGLQSNQFFVRHSASLLPLMIATINAYLDANRFEKADDEKLRMMAFHLRNMGVDITIAITLLVGGFDHMRAVSAEIRQFFAHESYREWEHRHCGGDT